MNSARRTGSVRRRALLSVLSQGANSVGNVVLTLFVAQSASQVGYGAWSVGYTVYLVALTMLRSLAGTPLLLTATAEGMETRNRASGALGLSVAGGVLVMILSVPFAIGQSDLRAPLLVFGLTSAVVLAQDTLRFVFLSQGRPSLAVVLDVAWLVLQVAAFLGLRATGRDTPTTLTLCWVLAAGLPALAVAVRQRLIPTWSSTRRFVLDTRHLSARLVVDTGLAAASTQTLPLFVTITGGLAATGALRGGLTLFGGINIVISGLVPVATLEARKRATRGVSATRFVVSWSVAVAALSAVYGLAILSIPEELGRHLLGATWVSAEALVVPLIIQSLLRGPYTGVPVVLRADHAMKSLVKLRLLTTVPTVVIPVAGAAWAGAPGAGWGLVASAVLVNAQSFQALRRHRKGANGQPPEQ